MWQKLICSLGSVVLLTGCSATEHVSPPVPIYCSVLTFESRAGMKAGEAESVAEMFGSALQNSGRFTVMERKRLDAIIHEREFQSAQNGGEEEGTGKIAGFRKMFSGSIGMLGEKYVVNLKMIDVESSRVDFSLSKTYDDDLADIGRKFLPAVVKEILQKIDEAAKK